MDMGSLRRLIKMVGKQQISLSEEELATIIFKVYANI